MTLGSFVARCMYLGAILHMCIGTNMSLWVCMLVGMTYMNIYENVSESVWVYAVMNCIYVHGCMCI